MRSCYHADESFQSVITGKFQLAFITENEPGYEVKGDFDDLTQAQARAKQMNDFLGLSAEDVLMIRASSLRASQTEAWRAQ